MKKAIITRSLFITMIVLIISSAVSAMIMQKNREQDIFIAMESKLNIALYNIDLEDDKANQAKKMSEMLGGMRITIVAKDGTVLADSHYNAATMENHVNREEIVQAENGMIGRDKRYSATLKSNLMYSAISKNNVIYRIAQPVQGLEESIKDISPAILIGILVAVAVTPFLAKSVLGNILRPLTNAVGSLKRIEQGDYSVQLSFSEYDELTPVMTTVNRLTRDISIMLEKLSDEQQKTKQLLDSMEQGLVLVDHKLRILLLNARANAIFESKEDMEGKNLIHLTYKSSVINAVCAAVEDNIPDSFDTNKQDSDIIYSVNIAPMKGRWLGDTKSKGAVILITDVTDIRRTQRIKSEFIDNASHELKTPITSIRGFSELLYAGIVNNEDKKQEYLKRINDEACRMTNIIDDILRLSQLESGQSVGISQAFAIKPLLEQIVESLYFAAAERQIEVIMECEDFMMSCNKSDINHMLTNIIENAVKYNNDGGNVWIKCYVEDDKACFFVKDTGIGIPPESQSRVFERFYRVDKSRSSKIGGTGLGLSIVKHIVSGLNGEISVVSDGICGTEMTVKIPLA